MKKRKTRKQIREEKEAGAPLCKCGCGKETKWSKVNEGWNEFIHNHHWVNKKHTEETRKKQSKVKSGKNNPMYGVKRSKDYEQQRRENYEILKNNPILCKCGCGKYTNWNYRLKQWNKFINSHHKYYYQMIFAYEDNNIRITEDDCLEIKCKNCSKFFKPTNREISARIQSLKDNTSGENHLYCSQECKQNCSIFNQKIYSKDNKPYQELRIKDWALLVKQRDNHTCQICGAKEDLVAHHFEGLNVNPIMSADLDMGITLCKECNRRAHSEKGCRYYDLTKNSLCK